MEFLVTEDVSMATRPKLLHFVLPDLGERTNSLRPLKNESYRSPGEDSPQTESKCRIRKSSQMTKGGTHRGDERFIPDQSTV